MAQRFAPDLTVDPMHEDLNTRVREFTRGIGADIVICANPIATTQTQAVEIVRKGGRVVLFGGLPKANPETRLDGNRIHYGEITITGAFSYHPSFHQLALDVIGHQLISARQIITHTFSLDQIDEAFAVAASGDALKVIVEPER
jgi:L-iditol 2-dehydrogenase